MSDDPYSGFGMDMRKTWVGRFVWLAVCEWREVTGAPFCCRRGGRPSNGCLTKEWGQCPGSGLPRSAQELDPAEEEALLTPKPPPKTAAAAKEPAAAPASPAPTAPTEAEKPSEPKKKKVCVGPHCRATGVAVSATPISANGNGIHGNGLGCIGTATRSGSHRSVWWQQRRGSLGPLGP